MKYRFAWLGLLALILCAAIASGLEAAGTLKQTEQNQQNALLQYGKQIFRNDTFGSEAFWGGQLRLHEAVATLSPRAALATGLKVDSEALPQTVVDQLEAGEVDLNDPAVTALLLKNNAVVGVKGLFAQDGTLSSVGITCALCHSTVDDSFAPGIGRRLDGWGNRDLNIGAIIALAPTLQPFSDLLGIPQQQVKAAVSAWGPGKFDAILPLDGKAFRPDGRTAAVIIPNAFGLAGVNLITWTGWGTVTYWNAFVANIEMHGQGTFSDARLDDAAKFPIAAKARLGHLAPAEQNGAKGEDLITSKLPALHFYQLSLESPPPPVGSFDTDGAASGKTLFNGKAGCARCHVPPVFAEPGWNMHTPEEIGIDNFQANRSPDERYRTSVLRGLWTRKNGFFHDGRFATLRAVVDHYNQNMGLGLTEAEKGSLTEYLKSL